MLARGSHHHPNRPDSAAVTLPQSTTMKVAFLSLLALVSAALAVPPYDPQSVFGVSEQNTQDIREGVNSIFDKAEDKVKQWVQDGRDFINHNGLTCQSRLCSTLIHGVLTLTVDCDQMNLLPTPRSPHIGFV